MHRIKRGGKGAGVVDCFWTAFFIESKERVRCRVELVCIWVYHRRANTVAKFIHLFPDVSQEGVTAPTTLQHDSIGLNFVEKHSHRGCGADRVASYLV